jgi:hypothetical protein
MLDAAAGRLRELGNLTTTADGEVLLHGDFWPPDRAEADGLEATHPLHTVRRLIDAPLPFPAGGSAA